MHYIKIIAIALVLFVCSNCYGQLEFSLNKDSILKSTHVKTETYFSFFSPTDSAVYCINNYDTLGNIISSKTFTKNGESKESDSLLYNDNNFLFSKLIYNKKGSVKSTWNYEYDTFGNCISAKEYEKNGIISCLSKSLFNDKHQLVVTYQKSLNKTYFQSAKYFYNNIDDLEKITYRYNNGDSTSEVYNYTNHLCNSIIYLTKQSKKTEYYNYDIDGRLTEITVTTVTSKKNKSEFKKLHFEYDSNGLCTQRLTYEQDALDEKTKCYYVFY